LQKTDQAIQQIGQSALTSAKQMSHFSEVLHSYL
jgi:hypothetical protein